MQTRIDNPALTVPGALKGLQAVATAIMQTAIPDTTLYLVELRASQINGCGVCVDIHSRELKAAGEPDARINAVAAWRDASYFTEAERAALALTEAATRLADRTDPVPDDVWDDAARHYDEPQLAALVLAIASINTWNRLNVATRQISGEWVGQWLATRRGRSRSLTAPQAANGSSCQGWRAAPGAARQPVRSRHALRRRRPSGTQGPHISSTARRPPARAESANASLMPSSGKRWLTSSSSRRAPER